MSELDRCDHSSCAILKFRISRQSEANNGDVILFKSVSWKAHNSRDFPLQARGGGFLENFCVVPNMNHLRTNQRNLPIYQCATPCTMA